MPRLNAPAYVGLVLSFALLSASKSAGPALHAHAARVLRKPRSNTAAATALDANVTVLNVCFSTVFTDPTDPTQKTVYFSAVFETDANGYSSVAPAFSDYLHRPGANCVQLWTLASARQMQQSFANDPHDPATAKRKFVDTGWRYGQPALGSGQSGFNPLGQGSDGLDLSQHRSTTYFCQSMAGVKYVSQIFQADWNASAVTNAWLAYLQSHYHATRPTGGCSAQSPSLQAGLHQNSLQGRGIVAVDWTYAPGEATGSMVAAAPETKAAVSTQVAAANDHYVFCNSPNLDGPVWYFSDIFAFNAVVSQDSRDVSVKLAGPFLAFLQKKYALKVDADLYPASWNGGNYLTQCSMSFASLEEARSYKQRTEDNAAKSLHKQIVETGWKNE